MFLREINASPDHLKGAGPETIHSLAGAGIFDLGALLGYYPRDWEDRSRHVPLKDWNRGPVCTEVTVLAHEWFGGGYNKTLKVRVEDESAPASLLCFNRPFLKNSLVPGNRFRLWGRFDFRFGEIQTGAFEYEAAAPDSGSGVFGRILPVYPLRKGLTQGLLRKLIRRALDQYGKVLEDELPQFISAREGFPPKREALRAVHFPVSMEELERAKKALIYEELFYLEIMVGKRALTRRNPEGKTRYREAPEGRKAGEFTPLQKGLLARLPFALTAGQEAAAGEINRDMEGPYPMARLLQGDVGSGKTLVAFLACLKALDSGTSPEDRGQAVFMAPTELLARQHAENAARLLEPLGVRIAFLTGNVKAAGRNRLLKNLAAGEIDIAVGTHALFSGDVTYRKLRLAVIDEQHRFGVTQRSLIMSKGEGTDLLMMSATPIPRTLALTVFGDLDISVIPDLPPGRKPVKTHLARMSNEGKVYDFVRRELAAGRQAYFVYPLIGGDEGGELKNVSAMVKRLSKEIFPDFPCALVHSRLEEEEKQKTMENFRRGDIRVLAATSVVEVGVDVPNASCMVVEHAERFGLSNLHQLRGRVGRGQDEAYCFLVYSDTEGLFGGALSAEGKRRLMVMLENNDGFVIAEEDLKLRGPGQIAGLEQSGYLSLGIADPVRDAAELARAREDAFSILEEDPELEKPEYRRIAEVLDRAPPFARTGF
ncbi:MAG: ATP-dependent DNA helicase RecG [Treponema sp.]|jgi:ATP-dependent DNA helicase RecG|nr:ATP-dependent DNA helicase RecG [Treponema sp.]